jgi:hypothetical protein
LTLKGARSYGDPMHARFQGVGVVSGETWIYDYIWYRVPNWPNGVDQRPAIVGSVIRTVPHSSGTPGAVSPASVVCSFIAGRRMAAPMRRLPYGDRLLPANSGRRTNPLRGRCSGRGCGNDAGIALATEGVGLLI